MVFSKYISIVALAAAFAIFAVSCVGGGDSGETQDEAEVRRAALTERGEALRTVETPSEIYPVSFADRDSLLEFISAAYDIFRDIHVEEFQTPPDEVLPAVAPDDVPAEMNDACFGVNVQDTAGLSGLVNYIDELNETEGEKSQRRFFLWIALSTQYNHNHDQEPGFDVDGTPLVPEADFKTFCGN